MAFSGDSNSTSSYQLYEKLVIFPVTLSTLPLTLLYVKSTPSFTLTHLTEAFLYNGSLFSFSGSMYPISTVSDTFETRVFSIISGIISRANDVNINSASCFVYTFSGSSRVL